MAGLGLDVLPDVLCLAVLRETLQPEFGARIRRSRPHSACETLKSYSSIYAVLIHTLLIHARLIHAVLDAVLCGRAGAMRWAWV